MAFPDDPRDVMVGFAFGEPASADPTAAVYEQVSPNANDPNDPGPVLGGVTITRGRIGDAATTEPTRIETALRNTGGEFSPRNVAGPRFGTLRKGTPMQVQVDAGSGPVVRGRGAVPDWNPKWAGPGIDDKLPIRALGLLSRLGRIKIHQSALRRFYDDSAADVVSYWPMTSPRNVVRGGASMRILAVDSGGVVEQGWRTSEVASWLEPGVSLSAGILVKAERATGFGGTSTTFDMVVRMRPGDPAASWGLIIEDNQDNILAVFFATWVSGAPTLQLFGSGGPPLDAASSGDAAKAWDDEPHHWRVTLQQSGSNINVAVYIDGDQVMSGSSASTLVPVRPSLFINAGSSGAAGHIIQFAGTPPAVADAATAASGHANELAADRITRLCAEEGIPFDVIAGDSAPMGPQRIAPLLELLRECEAVDHGILYELLDGRLGYKPLSALYNQPVTMALDFGTEDNPGNCNAHPVDDDRDLYNIVTVQRPDGAEAVAELQDGPAGISESVGVGPRPMPPRTLNIAADDQAIHHASWLLHETTTDKPRALVTIDLRATPEIVDDWLACDIGSRITIANAPAQHFGPDDLDLIIVGCVETLDADRWQVLLYCEPYAPYDLGEYQDTDASGDVPRYDTEWSRTVAGLWLPGTSGSYASTPDDSSLDLSGDCSLRADVTLRSWATGSEQSLISKWAIAGNQRGYRLFVDTDGTLCFARSPDGSTTGSSAEFNSTVAVTPDENGRLAVRADFDADNGSGGSTVTFYTSTDYTSLSTTSWTQLGAPVTKTGTSSIFNSSAALEVGSFEGGTAALAGGVVHAVQVRGPAGAGSIRANARFDQQDTGATSFTDTSGRTWTVHGSAKIVNTHTTGTDTALIVVTTVPPHWTTDPPGGWPILIKVRGVQLTVSSISGSASPQLFTISATNLEGVEIPPGDQVRVARPGYYAH